MNIDYIIIGKDFYFKNNSLYKRVYNIDLKDWVYILVDTPISLDDAIQESNSKLIITKEMYDNYILAIDTIN